MISSESLKTLKTIWNASWEDLAFGKSEFSSVQTFESFEVESFSQMVWPDVFAPIVCNCNLSFQLVLICEDFARMCRYGEIYGKNGVERFPGRPVSGHATSSSKLQVLRELWTENEIQTISKLFKSDFDNFKYSTDPTKLMEISL